MYKLMLDGVFLILNFEHGIQPQHNSFMFAMFFQLLDLQIKFNLLNL